MKLDDITPLILTFNEEANIRETLSGLTWAKQIVVVDSFSSDGTVSIVSQFPNVRLHQRVFDDHTQQWNFGLDQVTTPWTLAMDADYRFSPKLVDEIRELDPSSDAFAVKIDYAIFGCVLRSSLYPPRVSLFKTGAFRYRSDGHTQLLELSDGVVPLQLRHGFIHDDRKAINRWLTSQLKYAELEADKLAASPTRELGWKDRIRRAIILAPPLTLLYCLFYKLLILDGWAGWFYSLQRVFAELLLSIQLLDRKLRK